MEDRAEISVGSLDTLHETGVVVVRGDNHNIAVFEDGGKVYAVDNRCPHMGFPLDRGSVSGGILTCHWHQARFDLESGCTFDLWADDALKFATRVVDGQVYVATYPENERTTSWYKHRLIQGIEQNVDLVQAKSLLALTSAGLDRETLLADIVEFGAENLDEMSEGMIRLGCVANLYPRLRTETAYQGLLYATRKIANEIAGAVPHRSKDPLDGGQYEESRLKAWLRQWVQTRHEDGVERTLLTGLSLSTERELADLVFSVACERLYADGGHLIENCNKVFELTGHLGTSHARQLFPLLVNGLARARGEEESTNWHHPIEIVRPLEEAEKRLSDVLDSNDGSGTIDAGLIDILLGDDPIAIIEALNTSLADKIDPLILAREVAYAAALRLARFATSNEVTDWFNPQHTFIHANAVYQAVKRSPTPDVVRAVYQGAISVYMDRFLNVPPARLPCERNITTDLSDDSTALRSLLLEELNRRSNIDHAANVVARYLSLGHPFDGLVDTIALATLREDLDFHSLQVLDAAVNQCEAWDDASVIENIMVGVIRNLAAHCPTRRAGEQTARIAAKLQRGERIFEETEPVSK